MTKQEYAQWSRQESPRSNGPLNILKAFVSGGVVCLLGQLLIFFFQNRGAGENAPVFVSLCLIVLSALLTALNVYDRIRYSGTHYRICQFDGQRGDGI